MWISFGMPTRMYTGLGLWSPGSRVLRLRVSKKHVGKMVKGCFIAPFTLGCRVEFGLWSFGLQVLVLQVFWAQSFYSWYFGA